ncbi:receptor-type tyrosine-protein phosphatase T-like [Dreissena polymorpha]|uniref:receptor-type tyrosine-protein phosphatase T-like n=1 Tax=Dreissena polymorpha TaxID=45954 RepID=UPI002264BFA8|nr:receptor-type tyrosine-protein phosphatase T-like [Dreissena polymorpha]
MGRTDGVILQFINITLFGGNADSHMVQQRATSVTYTRRTYEISPPQAMQAIVVVGQQGLDNYMTICEIDVYRQEDCMNGTYGPYCEQRCHCLEGPCDLIIGTCGSGCQAGWSGAACNQICDNGWYGLDCRTKCGRCLNNVACKKTSGECPTGCVAGYKGFQCIEECDNGYHGLGCQNKCGYCQNKVACNTSSGVCPDECEPGYKGTMCTDACDNGWYGQGCLTRCGQCLNNAACNKTAGMCPDGCAAGYKGSLCIDECENERYGLACEKMCGHCKNKVSCNKLSGVCSGECEHGYNGTMCMEECDVGFFGDNCSAVCGECSGACHHIDGICSQGCKKGFAGDLCMTQLIQSELTGPAVGGSVGGIVLIAIIIVSMIAIKRRRSTPTKRHQFDGIPVAIQNDTDSNIDQTPTTSKTKPLKGPNGAISDAVYANTGYPEEDGLYFNSEPLHRQRKRTEIRLIAVDKLREFVRDNYQNEKLFKQEFDKIPHGLQHPTIVASAATGKNRYKEVYAYDHSRVILTRIADEPHSDYINACHVDGYTEEKKYIASQGPVNPMVGDFWRMVWEQDVCIIVMVTRLVEEGKMKCLKYWGECKPIIHGYFVVTLSEEKEYSGYTIRTITVHEKDKPHVCRNVTQFHYTTWPDKSVPTSSTSLVQFWRKIRCQKRTAKQPWLIHCSAGVGRTGTFIAMDYLYDQGKETGNIDIPQCVTNLRAQRVNTVQTSSQYRFLYKLMVEMLVLPSQPVTPEQLSGENMGLKEQYLDLVSEESLFPDDNTYKSATSNENQSKNRSMDILAADNYRPYLSSYIPNTTDYINAVIMPSVKLPTRFIITQSPLEHSFVDFCRLICEKEIELIISFDVSPCLR